ncbi:RidA family protein [Pontibacter sp. E15-1]|uniref:RidA family protein n=1 Tax=Pontibacter sp. E15-1 TaxID=2919918 RepID=UPI001F50395F|nr:RidA family protein [Pontibacter sp. E15-1]MCJ8165599.1 RidA family protein [Pontibacter sp. E15-1]
MNRQNISSGAVWEEQVGYSRAVRVGNTIEVSGTTATDGEQVIGKGDPYAQTRYALEKIAQALAQAGATMADVVRTRIYTTDISQWQEIGRAHAEFFRDIKPAATMVQVSALIHPDLLVEIEATAILPPRPDLRGKQP